MIVQRAKLDSKRIPLIENKKLGYYFDKKKYKLVSDKLNKTNNKDYYSPLKCLKCNSKFSLTKNNDKLVYKCNKCNTTMSFVEYQKRYINLNWFKSVELGVKLYSWDSICPHCNNINPCISYCINQDFGNEDLCMFEPILLGSIPKLDNFIMKFCPSINLYPNNNHELAATIICSKCDAPYAHEFLVKSFLEQKMFDIEFNIKKDVLKNLVNLKVTDVTKVLNNLVLITNRSNNGNN